MSGILNPVLFIIIVGKLLFPIPFWKSWRLLEFHVKSLESDKVNEVQL